MKDIITLALWDAFWAAIPAVGFAMLKATVLVTLLLVGGHDRGLDWSDFAARMRTQAPAVVVTLGRNGPRIHALLAEALAVS